MLQRRPACASLLASLLAALLAAACSAPPALPGSSAPRVRITGAVKAPTELTAAELAAQPGISQTVSFATGHGTQTHTYTGASLWSLLDRSGLQTDASHKSNLQDRLLVATGSDGYRVVFSLGELSPDFGNRQSLVAYASADGGGPAPSPTADGAFRLTAPKDFKGGRYVSNLAGLEVRASGAKATGVGGGVSPQFAVSGQVKTPATFDVAALRQLPAATATVGGSTYTGVSLWRLLNTVGVKTRSAKNPTLPLYVVATGSDGYRAQLSLGEIDPGFGNNDALVAYQMNGAPLGANGDTRLVVPGEVKQGRSVSRLIAIEVLTVDAP